MGATEGVVRGKEGGRGRTTKPPEQYIQQELKTLQRKFYLFREQQDGGRVKGGR